MNRLFFPPLLLLLVSIIPVPALADEGTLALEVSVEAHELDGLRSGSRAVVLEKTGEILLYGGAQNVQGDSPRFEFDGRLQVSSARDLTRPWKTLEVKGDEPGARSYGTLVLGPRSKTLYLQGGFDPQFRGELYAYDIKKKTWSLLSDSKLPGGPGARDAQVACDDGTGRGFLLYSGLRKESIEADLWFWDYKKREWSRIEKKGDWPGPRFTSALCKPDKKTAILFGGLDGMAQATAETWQLDTKKRTWKQLKSAPLPLSAPAMVWHPKLERALVFGGSGMDNRATDGILAYDPAKNEWARIGKLEQAISHATAVYCPKTDCIVLMGGTTSHFAGEHPKTMVQKVTIKKK